MYPPTTPEIDPQHPNRLGGHGLTRRLAVSFLFATLSQLGGSVDAAHTETEQVATPITSELDIPVVEPPGTSPVTISIDTIPPATPPTTDVAQLVAPPTTAPNSSPSTTEATPTTTDEQATAPEQAEVQRPIREFEHGELIYGAELSFEISRTGKQVNLPLHAFTDSGGNLNDGPILDLGGAVVSGDGYPFNIYGIHEPYVDKNGNKRPMVVAVHRTTGHAAGRDIAMTELGNRPDREGDRLEYNGREYEAVEMHLLPDTDIDLLNELLGTYYDTEVIVVFACTEENEHSEAAVEAARNGTYDVEDPYLTAAKKKPNARILVFYIPVEKQDTNEITHLPI